MQAEERAPGSPVLEEVEDSWRVEVACAGSVGQPVSQSDHVTGCGHGHLDTVYICIYIFSFIYRRYIHECISLEIVTAFGWAICLLSASAECS